MKFLSYFLFSFFLITILIFSACGGGKSSSSNGGGSTSSEDGSTDTNSSSSSSSSNSSSSSSNSNSTGTGVITQVPNDPCADGHCKSLSVSAPTQAELPRELWCRYGYPGADEYCKVKINEKAFHKK